MQAGAARPRGKCDGASVISHEQVRASRLRVLLYVTLALSAGVALLGTEEIQHRILERALAPEWRLAPAALFCVALFIYAVDRVLLVRSGRYPSGRAFFQVAFGLVVLSMLMPGGLRDYRSAQQQRHGADPLLVLMDHSDGRVRSIAAELAGRREDGNYLHKLVELLADPKPAVRLAARQALERRTGRSMGEDESATTAWRTYVNSLDDEEVGGQAAP